MDSFDRFLYRQRRRLSAKWRHAEDRIMESRMMATRPMGSMEVRKAPGAATLVSTHGVYNQTALTASVDDCDTNEGWR